MKSCIGRQSEVLWLSIEKGQNHPSHVSSNRPTHLRPHRYCISVSQETRYRRFRKFKDQKLSKIELMTFYFTSSSIDFLRFKGEIRFFLGEGVRGFFCILKL
jgi:hypothetical protein